MSHQARRETEIRRRNGKLQSCEPCRKGKLRCDHMMPTCGRCARRNKPEQCVYHPAPLTKTNTLPTPQTSEASQSIGSPQEDFRQTAGLFRTSYDFDSLRFSPLDETPALPRQARASSLPAQTGSSLNYRPQGIEIQTPLPDYRIRGGSLRFLETAGFVSHAAILAENEISIGIAPPRSDSPNVPVAYIERGAVILAMLKDLPTFDTYMAKWFSFTRGIIIIQPMVEMWSSKLWSTWHKALETQKPDGLRQMSEKIWENTMRPLSVVVNGRTTPREFVEHTTGEHLRWETVGILLTIVGLMAQCLQDGDPIFCSHDEPPVDRRALALKTCGASEECVSFCNQFDILNDLFLWLLYESTVLSASMHAKGSYANWLKSGVLCNAMVAFGLHQEIKADDETPFFISEFRKRLFVVVYENDKLTSIFIGRPPRLTRQYCRIQLPLDLTDAQTMSDGLDLETAIAGLDHEGWNQRGVVQRCTFSRVFASNALIMEEILELSLGFLSNEEVVRRAADIEARTIQLWEDYPAFLKLDDKHPWDRARAPIELVFLAYIKLDVMWHHFLLQRILIKKVGVDSAKLLAVSRETFAFVLFLMNNRDFLRDFQLDITQLLCMNGIPAAAVIAVELLHQEQGGSSLTTHLPRSETIQDLSVLVACLGTIRPESGGYAICERGKKFLKKILDTILEPPSRVRSNSSVGELSDPSFTMPLFQTGSDGDFVRWLESMEWEQENWVNFN